MGSWLDQIQGISDLLSILVLRKGLACICIPDGCCWPDIVKRVCVSASLLSVRRILSGWEFWEGRIDIWMVDKNWSKPKWCQQMSWCYYHIVLLKISLNLTSLFEMAVKEASKLFGNAEWRHYFDWLCFLNLLFVDMKPLRKKLHPQFDWNLILKSFARVVTSSKIPYVLIFAESACSRPNQ